MILVAGNVYCGCCDGNLYSISKRGEINWTFNTTKPIYTSPSLPETIPVVLFGSHDGYVSFLLLLLLID